MSFHCAAGPYQTSGSCSGKSGLDRPVPRIPEDMCTVVHHPDVVGGIEQPVELFHRGELVPVGREGRGRQFVDVNFFVPGESFENNDTVLFDYLHTLSAVALVGPPPKFVVFVRRTVGEILE